MNPCRNQPKTGRCQLTTLAALFVPLLLGLGGPERAHGEIITHYEDFTTRAAADTVLTTARWNVEAGQLTLQPLGLITVGSLATGGTAYAGAWRDGRLLLVNGSGNALLVIDATNPAAPALVKTFTLPANGRHIAVNGTWAYVSLGSGLGVQLVDVTNVDLPVGGARVDLGSFTGQTVVSGSWAYAAAYNGGVGVIEVTDPANPVRLANADLTAWVRGIALQSGHLFLAADNSLTVMSLADAAAPDSIARVALPGTAYCIAVNGNRAYLGGPAGLDIIDISVPASPQLLSSLSLGGGAAYDIAAQGDSLFVANGSNGLKIVDVSDPWSPAVVATRLQTAYFYHTLLSNNLAWTSNGADGLLVLRADPLGLDPARNLAVSADLNPGGEPVKRAMLTAITSDSLRFEVSVNGTTWLPFAPDGNWLAFEPQGTSLRWRATLVQTGPYPGPVCDELTLTFERLHSYADITAVSDVPGDAGGQVRVIWTASRFDAVGQSPLITEYSLYRRYDAAAKAGLTYPPGDWEYLLTVPADREAVYAATVPTLADSSTFVPGWEVFFVRARAATPGTYFDSPPDSGYSVNNLAPQPPTGLVIERGPAGVQLTWDPPVDPDFAHFRLYRSAVWQTVPSPGTLYQVTTGTSFYDATPDFWYYQLTAVNLAGLESVPVLYVTAAPTVPLAGRILRQNTPNPFNPVTRVDYLVPAGGSRVRLDILDFRGRLVAVLVDRRVGPGEYSAVWQGRDRAGRAVASGLYTCRLTCGGHTTTMKMTLVR
jgi:hypothetical protein